MDELSFDPAGAWAFQPGSRLNANAFATEIYDAVPEEPNHQSAIKTIQWHFCPDFFTFPHFPTSPLKQQYIQTPSSIFNELRSPSV